MKVADLELRPATLDDAPFAADMHTALRPDDPAAGGGGLLIALQVRHAAEERHVTG